MRADLQAVGDALLRRPDEELSLDVIAEALGTLNVDSEEIESLFVFLEQHDRRIGEASIGKASASLAEVLRAARSLRMKLGRTPSAREIAEQSGVPLEAVRRALLFSQIVQR